MRPARMRQWFLRSLAVLLLPLGFLGWNRATNNFGTLAPGRIFRSGQMPAESLARTIRAKKIRTVLNLRGPNPSEPWYRAERSATLGAGATQIDIAMSSCLWMSRVQLRTLVHVLDTCEYPLLIHCGWGSERTGLASAFAELLRPGATLDDARAQFSIRYLFVRVKDGKIMAEHLDQYEAWLRAQGKPHHPDQFRRWVAEGFHPGQPGREQWPYDPFPLVVITRPATPDRLAEKGHETRNNIK
jgi:protein tyrosine phosphatase (PTP) superfamily phosphohydrolase (DUF442 family)